jgi:alpha-glucosidase
MLSLYRRLLILRRSHAALVQGTIANVAANGDVLTYDRGYRDQTLFIALNFGVECAAVQSRSGVVVLSTSVRRDGEALAAGTFPLAAGEAIVASV